MIRRIFSPPVFDKEEDNFRAKFINGFAWVAFVNLSIYLLIDISTAAFSTTRIAITALIAVSLFSIFLLRTGSINASGIAMIILGWIGLTYQAYNAAGVKDVILFGYVAVALIASIIINQLIGGLVILFSIVAVWALALLETNGYLVLHFQTATEYAVSLTLILIAISVLIFFSSTSLRDAIIRANKSEEGLRASNKELQEINTSLEDRVTSRTLDLELANRRNEKRARQFEAIAQITRATTTNESLETLLPRITTLVSEQFGFYHTGVFLLDENREFAILRAANSEGGERMLERGHKLQIGQTGMVGFVSAAGSPRIALDVGSDAVFFNNPDLPNTRSEMALPLRSSGEIIGVLDAQSTEQNAFQEQDIEVLSTLADQIAIAIQNSRTYQTMRELLEQAQKASGTYIQDAWRVLQSEEASIGYRVAGDVIGPIDKPLTAAQMKRMFQNNQTLSTSGNNATLAIPIRLRNEVVGMMDIRTPSEHEWDADEVDIAEAVADRLSLALESSLLLKSTQRQAEIERITADISAKIGATTQFDSILRTTAEELSRVLGGSEVLVQIQSPETPNSKEN